MVSAHLIRCGIRSRFPSANGGTATGRSIPLLPRPSTRKDTNSQVRTLVTPEHGGAPRRSGWVLFRDAGTTDDPSDSGHFTSPKYCFGHMPDLRRATDSVPSCLLPGLINSG